VLCERTSVGLDVHARSVVAAAIDGQTGEVFKVRLTPSHRESPERPGRFSSRVGRDFAVRGGLRGRTDRVRVGAHAVGGRSALRGGRAVEAAPAGWRSGEDRFA
jgi:hypothetical protein